MAKRILVTGGAGFVGSHCCKALAAAGYEPVVYDDFRRGNRWAVRWGPCVEAGLEDGRSLRDAMRQFSIEGVMHFAAYAYVGESFKDPSSYFLNNVSNSINVLDAMVAEGVRSIVISSTCATYGIPPSLPITEDFPLAPINPYGASKVMLETVAKWYSRAHDLRYVALRYFNAAGADPDGEIGELHDPEPHLLPIVIDAALGRRPSVQINGTDYPTRDGTAIRDYVHVSDLATAHVAAMDHLREGKNSMVCNLGTGAGTSVREIIEAVTQEVGSSPLTEEVERRPGDPPELVADPSKAHETLGWRAKRSDIESIVGDAVRWYRDILPKMGTANSKDDINPRQVRSGPAPNARANVNRSG